jgi:hypothetical protein
MQRREVIAAIGALAAAGAVCTPATPPKVVNIAGHEVIDPGYEAGDMAEHIYRTLMEARPSTWQDCQASDFWHINETLSALVTISQDKGFIATALERMEEAMNRRRIVLCDVAQVYLEPATEANEGFAFITVLFVVRQSLPRDVIGWFRLGKTPAGLPGVVLSRCQESLPC